MLFFFLFACFLGLTFSFFLVHQWVQWAMGYITVVALLSHNFHNPYQDSNPRPLRLDV
uniref:Uncharacterized protein n=1 Tax=Rhizophora mucronata TaxID=61149 RepID=A0A2P2NW87_RHIMU